MARNRNQTETDTALSPAQEAALVALLSGQNQKEAALAADCTESTLSRWSNSDPAFIAELNKRRRELWSANAESLRSLSKKAIDRLEKIIEAGSDRFALQAIEIVLKSTCLEELKVPGGPETAQEVAEVQMELDAFRRLTSLR